MSDPWLTKADAARALGVGERTVDKWIAERKLGIRHDPMPGRQAATMVDPADVERMNAERHPARGAILQQSAATSEPMPPERALTVLARLSQIFPAQPAVEPKRFLTLPAAAEYCGLPAPLLRRLIRAGRLPAERYWRDTFIRTADLDMIAFGYLNVEERTASEALPKLRKLKAKGA